MKKKKNNLELLLHEQQRLKLELKERELLLSQKLEYAKENFGTMLINSVLPFSNEQREKVSGTVDKINNFILKMIPGKKAEDQGVFSNGMLKSAQLITAGIVFKYLKKLF